jgi:signal transduction histidine kinase
MQSSVSFQTRARTIDHLGREQIADCPTAISELWKNSFDAYARNVELHIIEREIPIAAVLDDGHGMNLDDLLSKWLVIGTESKKEKLSLNFDDLNGLSIRPKQGQKGIGRLSSAIMGPLLLLISKKKNDEFIACLIDWRLFENPYLYLHDIEIPIQSFSNSEDLLTLLPDMFNTLMSNIWGSDTLETTERDQRIESAWSSFDGLEKTEGTPSTKNAIESTIINTVFETKDLEKWDVWSGKKNHGTALFIANINPDLIAQLHSSDTPNSAYSQAQRKFFTTLSSFTEKYVGKSNNIFDLDFKAIDKNIHKTEFNHRVITWKNDIPQIKLSDEKGFSSDQFDLNDHLLSGYVDKNGTFSGRLKVFSNDVGTVEIPPPYTISDSSKGRVGGFHITVASFEVLPKNSSLPLEIFYDLNQKSELYAGFLVYRDGLRVMPYGREDNDFFEIEYRRSKNAGLYHYSNRNIFGRIVLTGKENSNLKDKAGREGFIDNAASKAFKDIVVNLLESIAKRYIGRESNIRKETLPQLQSDYKKRKLQEDKEKNLKLTKKRFILTVNKNKPALNEIVEKIGRIHNELNNNASLVTAEELDKYHTLIIKTKRDLSKLRVPSLPTNLENFEGSYREYRDSFENCAHLLSSTLDGIQILTEKTNPKTSMEIYEARLDKAFRSVKKNLKDNHFELREFFKSELERIDKTIKSRQDMFENELKTISSDIENNRISLAESLSEIEARKDKHDFENDNIFAPYISALASLQNNIDIEAIATMDSEELEFLQKENNRLNSLAQLGITVEIIGHELDSLDNTMKKSLNNLPENIRKTKEIDHLEHTYNGISSKFEFLSPLKLSGAGRKVSISGSDIKQYVLDFFNDLLKEDKILLEFSTEFESIVLKEEKSRIYPVFINIINNSRYWVCQNNIVDRKISVQFKNNKVYISDNGPGVDNDDVKRLFTIFFTKKRSGGRGIGLYLCRTNLAAGGHKITYVTDKNEKILSGANFAIDFKGIK